ncbi:MAG TPA: hypothetical protein VFJ70_00975 [Burkholderiales bacterium]|nr:hypothetical protein [Burkholderiales bacterium]
MTNRGLLLTMTEPPAAMEEEFNAWYDTEHLPERLAIPGFLTARRWVAAGAPGAGKYLATYELDCAGVLQSPAYLERFANATPWTRRCLASCVVFKRWACEQVQPGGADVHPLARAVLLFTAERQIDIAAIPDALQVRRFVASAGEPRHLALVELARPPQQTAAPGRLYRDYAA